MLCVHDEILQMRMQKSEMRILFVIVSYKIIFGML